MVMYILYKRELYSNIQQKYYNTSTKIQQIKHNYYIGTTLVLHYSKYNYYNIGTTIVLQNKHNTPKQRKY